MGAGKLYFGDNLEVLRSGDFRSESVDLVYLDPPFNSNREYNVLFQERDLSESRAQIMAFEDCWHWDQGAQETFEALTATDAETLGVPPALSILLEALWRSLPKRNDMLAYLVMMAPRLIELRRVLKPSGSLYLHCDQTASHYLKLLLDSIFGGENFRNEIIWKRSHAHNDGKQGARHYGRVSDSLFFYSKGPKPTWNVQYLPYDQGYIDRDYRRVDPDGRRYRIGDLRGPGGAAKGNPYYEVMGVWRHWAYSQEKMQKLIEAGRVIQTRPGAVPQYKRYLDEMPGVPLQNIWTDIPVINNRSKEKLGYPTQKPVALLERILKVSTNEGDVVLDPFCGCGTTIEAAQKLGRDWIGIDVTHLAIKVVRDRMALKFPGVEYDLIGEPQDVEGARELARTSPYQFQWWAVHELKAHPVGGSYGAREGRMGRDRGVDGSLKFRTKGTVHEVVISVKAGEHVSPAMVRELIGTVATRNASIGVLVTMEEPTDEMRQAALDARSFRSGEKRFPKIQLITAADLLAGKGIERPPDDAEAEEASGKGTAFLPGLKLPPPPARKGHRVKVPLTTGEPTALYPEGTAARKLPQAAEKPPDLPRSRRRRG
jgi:site-specific DNA-methyltransferase (adenine-specific)